MLEPTVSKQTNEIKPNVDTLDTAKKTVCIIQKEKENERNL